MRLDRSGRTDCEMIATSADGHVRRVALPACHSCRGLLDAKESDDEEGPLLAVGVGLGRPRRPDEIANLEARCGHTRVYGASVSDDVCGEERDESIAPERPWTI